MALDFVAGCIGGCAGVVVGHPLDTIKVLMQVEKKHTGIVSCVRDVVAKDSLRGLYRGVTSPMAGVAFVNAVVFGVYGGVQRRCSEPDSLSSHAIAGAAAGLLQSFICSPVELAKTRLQLGCSGTSSQGPLACLAEVARREGPSALFRGLGLTAMRDTPAFACYFLTYEALVRRSDGRSPGTIRTLMAGGFAGTASWLISFPIDAVKSRIQADGMTGPRMYSGAYDCLKKSIKAEGPQFLTRGLSAVLLRAFPTNAACFGAVSWCMSLSTSIPNPAPVVVASPPAQQCDVHYAVQAYKSLLFSSFFTEGICDNDIRDLHEDFSNVKRKNGACHHCFISVPVKLGILKEAKINS
ncbi:mitochondrial basic amino acids transporter-like [Arctopsyche grandis]|uniref:mitochondrial basic amino acids transporter-like n=1 Tax=Arctopsyche grandis TaxID=121162 RepID=UPI00406D68DB